MTTDYSKAYQLGQVDGAGGKNRLAMRSFKRLLNISAYFPSFEGCDAEFFDGYKDGFRDAIRVQQVILQEAAMPDRQGRGNSENRIEINTHRPTENWQSSGAGSTNSTKSALTDLQAQVQGSTHSTVSGSSTMSAPNIAQQILLLTKLKESLEKFRNEIILSSNAYEESVKYLGAHILQEMRDSYANKQLIITQQKAKDLTDHIAAHDIKDIEEKIKDLQAILARLNSM